MWRKAFYRIMNCFVAFGFGSNRWVVLCKGSRFEVEIGGISGALRKAILNWSSSEPMVKIFEKYLWKMFFSRVAGVKP